MKITEAELLGYALAGYQAQRAELDRRIEEVQRRINDGGRTEAKPARRKRHLSPEGRAAIAAAAKRRWAEARRAR